ncbi:hypothetical protein CCYA_CCYA02G0690 [Cyanidiococcus yangmingshanensis]|nr:hypothetical protein CCYA_CCYA02G0690 [Cyanidiococcus yangmingshanensis]
MPYVYDCDELAGYVAFMGRDKYENDALLEHALPIDWWFHVDKYSSAHVYVRPKKRTFQGGELPSCAGALNNSASEPPAEVVRLVAALTKENSIEGAKQNTVCVVYTPVLNLQKTAVMSPGQVGFRDMSLVHRTRVPRADTMLLRQLKRARSECTIEDMRHAREDFEQEQHCWSKAEARRRHAEEKARQELAARERDARSYARLHTKEAMTSNKEMNEDYEEEFL